MGTNSIGGFSFGLHGDGGLSCKGRISCRARSFLPSLCAGCGSLAVVGGRGFSAKMRRQCSTSPVRGPVLCRCAERVADAMTRWRWWWRTAARRLLDMRREWAPVDERLGSRVKSVCQKSRHERRECHKPNATQTDSVCDPCRIYSSNRYNI